MLAEPTIKMPISKQFTLRPTRMDDLEKSVEMFLACSQRMLGVNELTLEDVRSEWTLEKFDLQKNTRVVESDDGQIVGYIEVWDIDETPAKIWVWGRVHPDMEGQGVGTQLMTWAKGRALQAVQRVPDGIRVVMQSGAPNSYQPALDLFQDFQMTSIRTFQTMAINLNGRVTKPTLPEDIQIRSMQSEAELRDIVAAIADAFKDHWGYIERPLDEELEFWLHSIRENEKFDPSLWFLAIAGDEIAGMSLCNLDSSEDPTMGWVKTLGVRRPWRRQGLGLALLQHSFAELQGRGKARVGLGVDAKSLTGATRLYEKAGMKPIRHFSVYELELRPGRDITTQTVT